MKKSFKFLALSLVLVTLVAAFASCGAPAKNPDDAKAALEDNGYAVLQSDLLASALALAGIKDVDSIVSGSATIDDKFETVTILYFKDKDAANEAWENAQKYANDKKEDKAENWVVKKSGAMIYFGTPNAIKAAK